VELASSYANLPVIGSTTAEASAFAKPMADTSSDRHVGPLTGALIDLDNQDCIA
jgi:hypothetical protein